MDVGLRPVQQILHDAPYLHYKRMISGRKMNAQHRLGRVPWSKEMLDWNGPIWRNFIFTDEKKFKLDDLYGLQCSWHDLRKKPEIFPKCQYGRDSFMNWAGISHLCTSDLHLFDGTQNSTDCCSVLQTSLLTSAVKSIGPIWIKENGNSSMHTTNYTKI